MSTWKERIVNAPPKLLLMSDLEEEQQRQTNAPPVAHSYRDDAIAYPAAVSFSIADVVDAERFQHYTSQIRNGNAYAVNDNTHSRPADLSMSMNDAFQQHHAQQQQHTQNGKWNYASPMDTDGMVHYAEEATMGCPPGRQYDQKQHGNIQHDPSSSTNNSYNGVNFDADQQYPSSSQDESTASESDSESESEEEISEYIIDPIAPDAEISNNYGEPITPDPEISNNYREPITPDPEISNDYGEPITPDPGMYDNYREPVIPDPEMSGNYRETITPPEQMNAEQSRAAQPEPEQGYFRTNQGGIVNHNYYMVFNLIAGQEFFFGRGPAPEQTYQQILINIITYMQEQMRQAQNR